MEYLLIASLILAPAYALRFAVLRLPTDVLMMYVFSLWLFMIIYLTKKRLWIKFFDFLKNLDKKILVCATLLLLAAAADLFFHGSSQKKLGQFLVLFIQPISIFLLAGFIYREKPKAKNLFLWATYVLLAAMGVYAIFQYFTLIGLPTIYWGNSDEPKRAVSFFGHPNFYALFSAPLLALLVPDAFASLKAKILNPKSVLWLFGAIGLLLSMSRAGWLGLGAAVALYLLIAADSKTRKVIFSAAAIVLVIFLAEPNLRWRLILPFYGEKSAVSRFSLWHTGFTAIEESPIFGLGLTGFAQHWEQLNKDVNLTQTHNFPHNIFLDFWVETGLLGMLSFIGLVAFYLSCYFKNRKDLFALSVSLFLVALILQGQIDNPYFKNDLALVFWLVLSLVL